MNALKIAIDGRMINESGIGRYIRNLIEKLQFIDKKNEYFILHLKDDYNKLEYKNNFHKVLADFSWYGISEQVKLLGLLKSLKPDLVHFPHFNIPIFYNGKFVVTIHDLIHQHFSMERATTHGLVSYQIKQAGYKIIFKNALAKSAKILAPSYFVKDQLVKGCRVNEGKIIVTPEAVDDKIVRKCQMSRQRRGSPLAANVPSKTRLASGGKCQMLLKKLNISQPFIFYVGNAHPHKNVEGLIRVFGQLQKKYNHLSLVLSGNDHYFWQRIKREYQDKDIIYTGRVSDEELVALYKNAACFVMPSLEEGFGIPILEAFACSCPVVSSKAGSLPEVGGKAALYFDPGEAEDMSSKVNMVLKSEEARKKLIEKGLKRYKEFSWQKLAKQTLEVYQQCG